MLGIIFLLLAAGLGLELVKLLLTPGGRQTRGSLFWLAASASFGVGTLIMTWAVYVTAWAASVVFHRENPLFYGNLLVMGSCLALLLFLTILRRKNNQKLWGQEKLTGGRKLFLVETVFFVILLFFLTWMMYYVFHIKDGVLYSGFSVYGDYAPHTAMMRSFSWGNNFPTQYPHYGGEDVKYHFMFQFLTGNLEYLGMRLDIAYNTVSILSLWGFLMILYELTVRIMGSHGAGILASLLFFFRSGTAFFRFAWEHMKAGDLFQVLRENTSFIGYTANENWGLWNFNVYLNQRHLGFGLLIASLAIWVFLEWVDAGEAHEEKGLLWLKGRLFTKQAWMWRRPETALFMGLILGLCSFWNGACVIGCLLILMGFGIFSDGKLDYAIAAAVTVLFSVLQSRIFINGQAVSPSFCFGFLAENKTVPGVLMYLLLVSGIFFLGIGVVFCFVSREKRCIGISFLFPMIFAFFVSLTPDINVNHKYVMISYAFLTMFWAWAIGKLFSGRIWRKAAAVLLVLCLTVTGIYDFVVILKDNDRYHRVGVNMESSLSRWLKDNLSGDDLLLTPEYSMNEVTMSGAMLYCGWPYYAWSAGYDTNYRAFKAVEMYTTADPVYLKELAAQEGITYILFEEGMEFEQHQCREDIIKEVYPLVYTSEDGRIRIYEA